MKITRELIDNGQKIIHINYEEQDFIDLKNQRDANGTTDEQAPISNSTSVDDASN